MSSKQRKPDLEEEEEKKDDEQTSKINPITEIEEKFNYYRPSSIGEI